MKIKHNKLKIIVVITISVLLLLLVACSNQNSKNENTEKEIEPLAMSISETELTLENGKIRLILNAKTGGIVELYNKQSDLYLTRDSKDAIPVRIQTATQNISAYQDFSYTIQSDDDNEKRLGLQWVFDNGMCINAQAYLLRDADEVDFKVAITMDDPEQPIISVEYPVVENIGTLSDSHSNYFASPFITGFLFENPVENFNTDFYGITKDYGLYPSGWEYPMQFSSYYASEIGGFYWQTRDGGDTIKSFTFTGNDGTLRLSIYHYLDDLSVSDVNFNYDICFANMTQGSWYEAANKYRTWAAKQSWVIETGKLEQRKNVDKKLYEDTTLTIFGYRVYEDWRDYSDIYDILKNRIDGKFLNVAIYRNNTYLDKINQYEDLINCFEFSSLCLTESAEQYRDFYSSAMMDSLGEKQKFTIHYYECATDSTWREYMMTREKGFIQNYDVDGFYYDVDIAADHPKQCYDTAHSHGTRVNVIRDFLEQIEDAKNLQHSEKIDKTLSVGTEMIMEQMLPYVNYYQARAGSDVLGWMEHDRIRTVIENGSAQIIPLFDYVYHEYGILRTDGYLIPDKELGDGFYYVAAYVALNGGIPEFNYEFYNATELPKAEDQNIPYIDFINKLGDVRTGYGKNYLVYGKMMPVPEVDCGKSTHDFSNANYAPFQCCGYDVLTGTAELDNVVVSAFEYEGKTAIFLCNVSNETQNISLQIEAEKDYGLSNGNITGQTSNKTFQVGKISKGLGKASFDIEPQQIIMLTLSEE